CAAPATAVAGGARQSFALPSPTPPCSRSTPCLLCRAADASLQAARSGLSPAADNSARGFPIRPLAQRAHPVFASFPLPARQGFELRIQLCRFSGGADGANSAAPSLRPRAWQSLLPAPATPSGPAASLPVARFARSAEHPYDG